MQRCTISSDNADRQTARQVTDCYSFLSHLITQTSCNCFLSHLFTQTDCYTFLSHLLQFLPVILTSRLFPFPESEHRLNNKASVCCLTSQHTDRQQRNVYYDSERCAFSSLSRVPLRVRSECLITHSMSVSLLPAAV